MSHDAVKLLRDSLYVGVGFGVLAFQKAQVRRREIERSLDAHLAAPRQRLGRLLGNDTP